MRRFARHTALPTAIFCVMSFGRHIAAADEAQYLSPVAIVADSKGQSLFIAEETARQVAVFDIATDKVSTTIQIPERITGLVIAEDDGRLYVTGGGAAGKVFVVDTRVGRVVREIRVGHTPMAPVLDPGGRVLYVVNRFDGDVSVVDVAARREVARIAVVREPVAAAVSPDGKRLLVANQLPVGAADAGHVAAVVSVIDTDARRVVANITLPNGSMGLRAICMSPDGRYAYVTHVLARYQLPATQLERGWLMTNALSIIDVTRAERVNTVLLDDIDLGAANPWGVSCTGDGRYLCVTHSGTHEVSVIDRPGLHEKLAKAAAGRNFPGGATSAEAVPNDLSFMLGLRRRLRLAGNGPRGLVVLGTKVYATEYFSDSLGVVDVALAAGSKARSVALGTKVPLTPARKGEMFFYDAQYCFQKWLSCSSCHPGEGRSDALNWDLLLDGIGTPKNTKSLLWAHKTPPTTITGSRPNAEASVRAGLRHIEFSVRADEDAVAIDAYLKSLEPVSSPHWVEGRLSEAARRGKVLFDKVGCTKCHAPPLYTDLKMHNVGTGRGQEQGRPLDTPTLVEVWRTAPYLHDGRAATMPEALSGHAGAAKLSEDEVHDLAEYVLSLPADD